MSSNPESDRVLEAFASELASLALAEGWSLVRLVAGNADRDFELRSPQNLIAFTAHLSQSANGFWGLTPDKAAEFLRDRREHLVLLRTASSGYFLSNPALQRLMPRFSVHKLTGAVKINEGVIRAQPRFRDVDDLWELLKVRSVARAP